MNAFDILIEKASVIEGNIRYRFRDPSLLALAFVHRSYINEHRDIAAHNERLEFLGDSVLGVLIATFLYREFPKRPEGELSSLRSRLVDCHTCMQFVLKLDIHSFLLLGRGEQMSQGKGRESILGDFFEALIGAIYLDGGLQAAHDFLFGHFKEEILSIIDQPLNNWKALFQDYCQKIYQEPPKYLVLNEKGPDHNKIFSVAVTVKEKEMGRGQGASKKDAQQAAAADALERLQKNG